MLMDKLTQVDSSATVTGGTTVVSVSALDVGTVDRALGTGRPLYLVIKVKAKANGDSSDTFRFDIVQSANADLSSNSIVASTRTITGIANITAGMQFVIAVPPSFVLTERYLGAGYAVTADAVLTVDAWFTDQPPHDHTAYPDGI